jgi:hypothetical protein
MADRTPSDPPVVSTVDKAMAFPYALDISVV